MFTGRSTPTVIAPLEIASEMARDVSYLPAAEQPLNGAYPRLRWIEDRLWFHLM